MVAVEFKDRLIQDYYKVKYKQAEDKMDMKISEVEARAHRAEARARRREELETRLSLLEEEFKDVVQEEGDMDSDPVKTERQESPFPPIRPTRGPGCTW